MAIGPAPLTSGDYSTNSITSGTTMTLAKPANLADGDTLFIWVMQSANSGTFTPPAGWTTGMSLTGRKGGLYYLKVPTASGVGSSFTLTTDQAGTRMVGICFRLAGLDPTTPVDTIASAETAGSAGAVTIAAASPVGAADFALALVYANPGSSTGATMAYPSGWTNEAVYATATNGTAASIVNIGYKQLTGSGSTGTVVVTGTGTPSGTASPSGLLLTLTPAVVNQTVSPGGIGSGEAFGTAAVSVAGPGAQTVSPSSITTAETFGTATVTNPSPLQAWLAITPNYVVHHGGEVSWPPQNTAQAFAQAHAWNPNTMFEAPVVQCSTGEYVLSETATTVDYTTVLTISTSTWAALSALRTTVGGFPMMRLKEDLLDVYGAGGHPLLIDNKLEQNNSTLLTLLAGYGGKNRIMAKGYFSGTSWLAAAHAAGYLTWGFYFDTDSASFAATHASFDYLGLNYGGTQAAWTALMAFGQPVWAHILNTAGSRATADGKATTAGFAPLAGYMISDVTDLIPFGGTPSPQTVSPGAITSSETFGAVTAAAGPVTVSPGGIATGQGFGTATVTVGGVTVTATAIASSEAFGTPGITAGTVTVAVTGVPSGETFGAPVINAGGTIIRPAGIVTTEQVPGPVVTSGPTIVVPTPPERTFTVSRRERAYVVPARDRTYTRGT